MKCFDLFKVKKCCEIEDEEKKNECMRKFFNDLFEFLDIKTYEDTSDEVCECVNCE